MWTRFWDMHSGGRQKELFSHCYIEAPEEEAKSIFYARFGHNPERVTCTCCGEDYIIEESESLEQLTGYHRGCLFDGEKYIEVGDERRYAKPYLPLEEYLKSDDVCVIYAHEIDEEERHLTVPDEGYVWV